MFCLNCTHRDIKFWFYGKLYQNKAFVSIIIAFALLNQHHVSLLAKQMCTTSIIVVQSLLFCSFVPCAVVRFYGYDGLAIEIGIFQDGIG